MKKLISILIFLTIYLNAFTQEKGFEMCSKKKSESKTVLQQISSKTVPTENFDVQNYTLNLDLMNCFQSPYSHQFTANETITFKALEPISYVQLDAANYSLTINSVTGAVSSFTHLNNLLTITLDQVYTVNQTFEINIDYLHKNVNDYSFYAKDGMVFTDSEPQGARNWYPCFDQPYDKATFNLIAKVPNNVLLGSNGILHDSIYTATDITYNWLTEDQIPTYLVSIAAKVNYQLDIVYWENSLGIQIPIRFYYNLGEDPSAMEAIMTDLTDFFSDTFCEHPFPKNGFASLNSDFSWGGMENQTLTNLCTDCWYESLIVHEYAHQWFGDMITCATWADIWLNEGFATYLEALWWEHTYNSYSAYKEDINYNASSYFSGNSGRAIYVPSWVTTLPSIGELFSGAITYSKSACVIHLLRYTLGDEIFFNFVKSYSSDQQFKYKSVTTQEFLQKLNDFTGEDYSWFIQDWIMQPNHPLYSNQYSFKDNGTSWTVIFKTSQTQATTFFRIPIEIKIKFDDNSEVVERFFNESDEQSFSFNYDKEPVLLTFDPDNEIVLKTATTTQVSPSNISNDNNFTFKIVPNPANEETTIVFDINLTSKVKISINDILGKEINVISDKQFSAGNNSVKISTSDLKDGIYFVKIISESKIYTQKLIIEK